MVTASVSPLNNLSSGQSVHCFGHVQLVVSHWCAHQRSVRGSKFVPQFASFVEVPGRRAEEIRYGSFCEALVSDSFTSCT